jgi:hypothetical protein
MSDCVDGWITRLGEESAHAPIFSLLGLQTTIGLHVLNTQNKDEYIDSMFETVELRHISTYSTSMGD